MDPVVVVGYLLIAAAVILLLLILGGFVWMGWELMQREDSNRRTARHYEPPTLDVQNHLDDTLSDIEFRDRWRRTIGDR